MFDVGFSEIALVAVVALLVLGPERLPKVARTVGALVRRARSSWQGVRDVCCAQPPFCIRRSSLRPRSNS
jgi:Tat protein translocase TatB subunit